MRLTKWYRPQSTWPAHLSELQDELDSFFQTPFAGLLGGRAMQPFRSGWSPAVDVYEDTDHLYVTAELPGLKKEEIDLSIHEGVLTLSGERKQEKQEAEAEVYRSERSVGRFERTLTLPTPVDADKAKAEYSDGVLTVTLPKTEAAKPRQIQVKTS